MKKITNGARVLLAIISTTAALASVEIGLRLFYPQQTGATIRKQFLRCFQQSDVMPFTYRPNCAWSTGTPPITVRINSMGIRNQELETTNKKRVLLIGDSFVFGSEVAEEDRIGDMMEKIGNMQVISAGFWGGAGPDTSYVYLRHWGLSLKPDLVAIAIFPYNDIEDMKHTDWQEDAWGVRTVQRRDISVRDGYLTGNHLADRMQTVVLDHSHLWALVHRSQSGVGQMKDRAIRKIKRWLKQPTPTYAEVLWKCIYGLECQGSWQQSVDRFRRLVKMTSALSKKENLRIVYFIIPESEQVFGSDPEWSVMRHVLHEEGAEYLDFFNALRRSGYTKNELYQVDGHWTPLGHEMAARAAVEWLESHPNQ